MFRVLCKEGFPKGQEYHWKDEVAKDASCACHCGKAIISGAWVHWSGSAYTGYFIHASCMNRLLRGPESGFVLVEDEGGDEAMEVI
jgi:hypothetical protein